MKPKYSVIIPLKNEEESITHLIEEIDPVMASVGAAWELLCIDDGSTDDTLKTLQGLAESRPYLRILKFDRNYGQSSAFDAGFRNAQGEFIITIDGDGQNDPADIPTLIKEADNYDLICGYRHNRKDPWSKKIPSFFANKIRSRLCEDGVSDTGCSLKLYRASCLQRIKLFNGMHRFLPALFNNEGFRIHELPVNHRPRTHGKTKYNFFNRSFNTVADMLAVRWMRKRHLGYQIEKEMM